jgi:NDP-sugar pyrophosphorylase family protein
MGFRSFIYSVGYKQDAIIKELSNSGRSGFQIKFVSDGPIPLGTGGAVVEAAKLVQSESFVVTYGDSYLLLDAMKVIKTYELLKAKNIMTIYENYNIGDLSNIECRDGVIINYDKEIKTERMRHIDYGMLVLNKHDLLSFNFKKSFDLSLYIKNLIINEKLQGYLVKSRFYEIGSRKGIEDFNEYLENRN